MKPSLTANMDIKQGYALKNWVEVEELSDEAYYPCPGSNPKKSTKIGQSLGHSAVNV